MSKPNNMHFNVISELDTCGLRCPIPIMQTKLEVSKLNFGECLLVIATDPSFTVDCRVFIRQTGHKLLHSWLEAEKFFFVLQNNHRSRGQLD